MSSSSFPTIAFIGGGNMASALIGGLRRQGHPAEALIVIEPHAPQRERLAAEHGLQALAAAGPALAAALSQPVVVENRGGAVRTSVRTAPPAGPSAESSSGTGTSSRRPLHRPNRYEATYQVGRPMTRPTTST